MHVIALYPNLVPGEIRQKIIESLPTKPPTLSGKELEEGLDQLIRYLTQMRYIKVQKYQQHQKVKQERAGQGEESEGGRESSHLLSEKDLKRLTETLQLIDTTLLKCYIKVGVAI